MGIPRKGSRSITVDGQAFRYMVKENGVQHPSLVTRRGGFDPKEKEVEKVVVLTVQEDADRPGRVLQASTPWGEPILPPFVEQVIKDGLKKGWEPSARGPAFNLGHLD